MGKRRRGQREVLEKQSGHWDNAMECHNERGLVIQVDGLGSSTGTIFARIKKTSSSSSSSLREIVDLAFKANGFLDQIHIDELFRLGAVWILPPKDKVHPQNPPKWERIHDSDYDLSDHEESCDLDDESITLRTIVRIHCQPSRFASSSKISAVSDNPDLGFVLINKPGGCPSHATVDNDVENALAVIKKRLSLSYASLPQRLDTDTFGLLLLASKPQFASYMSRIVEKKTMDSLHKQNMSFSKSVLRKRYRCLVVMSEEKQWHEIKQLCLGGRIITHYLDSRSPAPKIFRDSLPDSEVHDDSSKKWQKCQLKITHVSKAYSVSTTNANTSPILASQKLAFELWGSNVPNLKADSVVVQLEIELLTGRTHQIRGQLAVLGVPIVGDPLYGGRFSETNFSGLSHIRMALQCCELEFSMPELVIDQKGKEILQPTERSCQYALDDAWWTNSLKLYNNDN